MKNKSAFLLVRSIVVLIALLGVKDVFGQKPINPISFPLPDVAGFVRNIEQPVSLYNGQTSVTIPLYEVKDGMFTLPITLSYRTSGIKVAEEASMVGLGWNINLGGVITQQIIGANDEINQNEYENPLLNFGDADFLNPGPVSIPQEGVINKAFPANYVYYNSGFVSHFEANVDKFKPDVYYFDFLGHSGKFYIDQLNDSIYQEKVDENIYFEKFKINGKTAFRAVLSDGTMFLFNGSVVGTSWTTVSQYVTSPSSVNFYLTSIVFPDGQEVSFSYSSYQASRSVYTRSESKTLGYLHYDEGHLVRVTDVWEDVVLLSSIMASNIQVDMNYLSREDVEGSAMRLSQITIKDVISNAENKVTFYTSYFNALTTGNAFISNSSFDIKRLRLDSVKVKSFPAYQFVYNATQLPQKSSYAVDYWGYFNGQLANSTLLPKISFIDVFSTSDFSDEGACRAASENHSKACLLEKIIYPTGGYTTLNYELNTFDNYKIPTVNDLQDLGVFSYANGTYAATVEDVNANTQSTYSFLFDQDRTVGIDGRISYGRGAAVDVQDAYIRLYKILPNGSFETKFNWTYAADNAGKFKYQGVLSAGRYILITFLPDGLGDQTIPDYVNPNVLHARVSSYLYVVPLSSVLPYSKGAGLRVSRVDHLADAGGVPVTTRYTYNFTNSNGALMSGLRYSISKSLMIAIPKTCAYQGGQETTYYDVWESGKVISSSSHEGLSFSAQGGLVGYSTVREYRNDASGVNGCIEYAYHNVPSIYLGDFVDSYSDVRNGQVLFLKYFDKNNTQVKQTSYLYSSSVQHRFFGIAHEDLHRGPVINDGCGLTGNLYTRYNILFYAIPSRLVRLVSKQDILDAVTDITTMAYNSKGLLLSETRSDGVDVVVNRTSYFASNPTLPYLDNFLRRNQASEATEVVNDLVVRRQSFVFEKVGETATALNGITVPQYRITLARETSNNLDFRETRLVYVNNKLQQIKNQNGINQFYLWGYKGTRPIAEITGGDVSLLTTPLSESGLAFDDRLMSNFDNSITSLQSKFQLLRSKLPAGVICKSYTYDVLNGITSVVDGNGVKSSYSFDALGRLSTVRDNQGAIIRYLQYGFKITK